MLSRSSEAIDESLEGYALANESAQRVEIYRRGAAGWGVLALAPGDTVHFASVDATLSFDGSYDGSDVAADASAYLIPAIAPK